MMMMMMSSRLISYHSKLMLNKTVETASTMLKVLTVDLFSLRMTLSIWESITAHGSQITNTTTIWSGLSRPVTQEDPQKRQSICQQSSAIKELVPTLSKLTTINAPGVLVGHQSTLHLVCRLSYSTQTRMLSKCLLKVAEWMDSAGICPKRKQTASSTVVAENSTSTLRSLSQFGLSSCPTKKVVNSLISGKS